MEGEDADGGWEGEGDGRKLRWLEAQVFGVEQAEVYSVGEDKSDHADDGRYRQEGSMTL